MKYRTLITLRNIAAVLLAFLFLPFAAAAFLFGASLSVDGDARTLPSYARTDIRPILGKDRDAWTDVDCAEISRQTGVFDVEWLRAQTDETILSFQNALFFEGEVRHEVVADQFVYHDVLFDPQTGEEFSAPMVDVEEGDVLVTSTSHFFGWRHGHAALVVKDGLLQSAVIGTDSKVNSLNAGNALPWFSSAANFIVLRLKDADKSVRAKIAEDAEKQLVGVPYHFTAGIFTPKDQGTDPIDTYCSHLVWQAYKNAGYDIDFDGGPVCTPRDIANSPVFEVVQIYGFDPLKGW